MNYNCIKSLNVRAKTTELLEENTSVNFRDIELGKAFLAGTPKIQATKEKIDEMDIDRIKNCYASKGTVKKVKRQPTEREKIFANGISGKGLASRIHKEF